MNQTDLINSLVPGIPGLEEHRFGGAHFVDCNWRRILFFFALALRGGIHRLAADYWRHRGVFGFPAFPRRPVGASASRQAVHLYLYLRTGG